MPQMSFNGCSQSLLLCSTESQVTLRFQPRGFTQETLNNGLSKNQKALLGHMENPSPSALTLNKRMKLQLLVSWRLGRGAFQKGALPYCCQT